MHRMMYRTYLDRVSESVFGAQKFEFCPNKGKKSGSRIAYPGGGLFQGRIEFDKFGSTLIGEAASIEELFCDYAFLW